MRLPNGTADMCSNQVTTNQTGEEPTEPSAQASFWRNKMTAKIKQA